MTIRLLKPAAIISSTILLLILLTKPTQAMTVAVTGNGSDSTSVVDVSQTQQTTVQQTNTATVTNNISVTSNTGNNSASRNTGGDVSITTGNATTSVTVANAVNGSDLNTTGSGVVTSNHNQNSTNNTEVTISGNGSDSHNFVSLDLNHITGVTQNNSGTVNNNVDATANTGDNHADRNTGGSVLISTGNATTEVILTNNVNRNNAVVNPCSCQGAPKSDGDGEETPPPAPTEIAAVPAATPAIEEAGSVLAAATVLPATGTGNSNWVIYTALILIALGFYLRKKTEDWYFSYYNV